MKHTSTSHAATVGVSIFLLTFVMQSGYAQSPANSPLPPTPSGNGLNNYLLLPSAQLAFDDKSRLGAGLGGIGNGDGSNEAFTQANLPPKFLLDLAEDHYVGREHLYATSLLFSDNVRSLDLGAQWFSGDSHGYGVSIRYDPSRMHLVDALEKLYADGASPSSHDIKNALKKAEENAIGTVNYSGSNEKERLHPRYSVTLGFEHTEDDFQMANGTIAELGATTSVLIPTDYKALHRALRDYRHSPGITLLASAQLLQTYPDPTSNLSQSTLLRYGVGVIWQDRVPARFVTQSAEDRASNHFREKLDRWVVQIGLEYLPKNGVDSGRSVAGFVRYRPSSTKFFEMTLNGGCDEQGVGFVSLAFANSFNLDPHHRQGNCP